MSTITTVSISLLMGLAAYKESPVSNGPVSYMIGGIVALLILGYLIYSLLRPDKF
jgi:K+-transporting ATPase KdpF subunit